MLKTWSTSLCNLNVSFTQAIKITDQVKTRLLKSRHKRHAADIKNKCFYCWHWLEYRVTHIEIGMSTGWHILKLTWVQGDKCWHRHEYSVTNIKIGMSTGWQMLTLTWVQGNKCWHWHEYRVTNVDIGMSTGWQMLTLAWVQGDK